MKPRISVKALIFRNGKVLLVKHVSPKSGFTWWAFPGGGVEEGETIFAAAERETFEETGLTVKAVRVKFIRQLLDFKNGNNVLELFVTTSNIHGKETIENCKGKGNDDKYIKDCKFLEKNQLIGIKIFPDSLIAKIFDPKVMRNKNIEFIGVDKTEKKY